MATKDFTETNIVSPKFPETSPYFSSLDYSIDAWTEEGAGAYGFVSDAARAAVELRLGALTTQVDNLTIQLTSLVSSMQARQVIETEIGYTFTNPNPS